MSSKRILKKEVNRYTQEFISDAFTVIGSHPETREKVISWISDVVALRNDTIQKMNHPEAQEGVSVRKSMSVLRNTFLKELDSLYHNLSKTASDEKPAGKTGKTDVKVKTEGSGTPDKS